jgi:hypothetical protein
MKTKERLVADVKSIVTIQAVRTANGRMMSAARSAAPPPVAPPPPPPPPPPPAAAGGTCPKGDGCHENGG